tara:strand:- start:1482 stop:1823 length:342 start_codon:yes stop_codon:yes gene_type:complete
MDMLQGPEKDEEFKSETRKLCEYPVSHKTPKRPWIINFLFVVALLSFLTCVFVLYADGTTKDSEFYIFLGIGTALLLTFCAELLKQSYRVSKCASAKYERPCPLRKTDNIDGK